MVPFSLRLIYACLPQFLGRHNESLDRLFYVRGQVHKILHNLQNNQCEDGGATVISEASRTGKLMIFGNLSFNKVDILMMAKGHVSLTKNI